EQAPRAGDHQQIVIAGSAEEYREALAILKHSGDDEKVFGRINPGPEKDPAAIGTHNELHSIVTLTGIKEVIFCTGSPGFKKIIELLPSVPKHTRVRFFTPGSHSVIGSYDKNTSGRISGIDPFTFNLSNRFYRRSKRLTDAGTCLFFL